MSVLIDNKQYCRTKEAWHKAGIRKATFYRWIKQGVISALSKTVGYDGYFPKRILKT